VRRSGLTFAPEAGTQRLRDVINKGVTEEDVLGACATAFQAGWSSVKLYFMIGLPTETDGDLDGIAGLAAKVVAEYRKVPKERRGRGLSVTCSVSNFVPKPFTPFQWEAQDTVAELERKQRYLRDRLRQKHVQFRWHDARASFLEAAFARGGEGAGRALLQAWKAGCRFDGWSEFFDFEAWMAAFRAAGEDPALAACRRRDASEPLPWDALDYGISKAFLARERDRAYAGAPSPNCREACLACGVDALCPCPLKAPGAGTGAGAGAGG
jgi:radical SAM superfamily enzyme YgiQ (UPF0313 family)